MEIVGWLLLAAIFVVIEIITLGLTTIWFAGGAFVAAIVALAGGSLIVQVIVFIVVSFALLFLTRPLAAKYLDNNIEKTNVEALIGQTVTVLEEIDNEKGTGHVKAQGTEWLARTKENGIVVPEGASVRIVQISGVKLVVEPETTLED